MNMEATSRSISATLSTRTVRSRVGSREQRPVDCACGRAGRILHEGKKGGTYESGVDVRAGRARALPAISVTQPNPHAQRSLDSEMMTWPEVKRAIESGETTARSITAGPSSAGRRMSTEAILMGHATVLAIA